MISTLILYRPGKFANPKEDITQDRSDQEKGHHADEGIIEEI